MKKKLLLIYHVLPQFKYFELQLQQLVNKTLTIDIYQDPTGHVEDFLSSWRKFGTYEQSSDLQFILTGKNNKQSTLNITQHQIIIEGQLPSETFMIIDTLAKACEADKVIEGEVIDKNQTKQAPFNNSFGNQTQFEIPFTLRQFGKVSTLSKTKLILLLILFIPVLIIMIPIIMIVMIIKIIRFKLRF